MSNIISFKPERKYPLVPLRDIVVFPGAFFPLSLGRQSSLAALEEARKENQPLVFITQLDSHLNNPKISDLYSIGTLSRVKQVFQEGKEARILIEGVKRVRILGYAQMKPFIIVRVEEIEEKEERSDKIEALKNNVLNQFKKCVTLGKSISMDALINILSLDNPHHIADLIASNLSLKTNQKQEILESFQTEDKLRKLQLILAHELSILELGKELESKTQQELSKMQKEMVLREQLKTIQKELGIDDEQGEVEEFRRKIKIAKMPSETEEKIMKELNRFAKLSQYNPEASYLRTYLEWIADLPWNKKSKEEVDLKKAEKILNADHYGLSTVKERIIEYLAVNKLVGKIKGPILCFIGPSGTGKTSIGRSIARALSRKFVKVSLGGIRDEAEIRGHRRTYVGALPGRIIQGINNAKTRNPVFMLDEIDKIGVDFRGDPSAALLEALDPEQNKDFSDHYLEVPFDLSDVFFITTGNVFDTIPPALLDRMEIIRFTGYTEEEKLKIARIHLLPKLFKNHGLDRQRVSLTEDVIRKIIRNYTHEAGVRELERELASILRKVAKKVVDGKKGKINLEEKDVHEYLGPEKYIPWAKESKNEIGVATGLAWTQSGGEILAIESTAMPGKGKLILTGQLGEVMKESAQAALSYIRSQARKLAIADKFFSNHDFHIHIPEGAVPKDGPSAGVALATSLISTITKKPVSKDVGMTGEITLRGKVLEIGGVKEKVLAAHRAGLKKIILPENNKKNLLKDVPDEIRKDMKFVYVKSLDGVLKEALQTGRKS
ncbi:endopeptidase La [candidate division WWE3 bacterium CG06_land_8_20_14_3_00_42_16]|uniref:Lon protease n=4 Tax=Katanobacteria TaxID=422282 RepID=A0A2M7ANC0_UNCKA|nr:MAG: endopeptidase La [candidate division WWE3 bacterium CG06_land_8_20_14_3_00_42_16]PJA37219.1 MAG: endopeptidase La [candidate division WWE3 bacterium CG_4_9_14_3_um_filter_43_9]PJC69287.1 MAG: endopeptidase La [candidate division WWE3 bacterium CG_4_8_14_3_um_filter_42_11]